MAGERRQQGMEFTIADGPVAAQAEGRYGEPLLRSGLALCRRHSGLFKRLRLGGCTERQQQPAADGCLSCLAQDIFPFILIVIDEGGLYRSTACELYPLFQLLAGKCRA